jgi:uncharacterized protein
MLFPGGRRFYAFSQFLKDTLGFPAHKLVVDAGFTCPTIDGTRGRGGCRYCNNAAFSPAVAHRDKSIAEQVRLEAALARERYGADRFIAYFQAFTNTYAPVDRLRSVYDEALAAEPGVVGLAVGTRPDCVPDEVLDMLGEYARGKQVWLELGLQSSHDETLARIGRGHDYACFEDAVRRASGRGIYICVHVILGFPWETPEMERLTIERIAAMPIDGVKLHHLHIVRGTPLYEDYLAGGLQEVGRQTVDEHVARVCDALERLPRRVCLQRWCGEIDGPDLMAPKWSVKKLAVLHRIERELEHRGTWQGKHAGDAAKDSEISSRPSSGTK